MQDRKLTTFEQPVYVAAFVIYLVALVYQSFVQAPTYLHSFSEIKGAEKLYDKHDFVGSESRYKAALQYCRNGDSAKIGLAKALFQQKLPAKDKEGAEILKGLIITNSDKVDLINVMPAEYRHVVTDPHGLDADETQSNYDGGTK